MKHHYFLDCHCSYKTILLLHVRAHQLHLGLGNLFTVYLYCT